MKKSGSKSYKLSNWIISISKLKYFDFQLKLGLLVSFLALSSFLGYSQAKSDLFIIKVKTNNSGSSASNQFTIPTIGVGYNYQVDWEYNGASFSPGNSGVTASITHTYASADTFVIAIYGTFPRIYFNDEGDAQKLLEVEQWGSNVWSSYEDAFHGCLNLQITATDTPNLTGVTSMESAFERCRLLDFDIGAWDVSRVTSFKSMFDQAIVFNNGGNDNIKNWQIGANTGTSNIDMDYMFRSCYSFNQPLNNWERTLPNFSSIAYVNRLTQTFAYTQTFNQNLGAWNVGRVYEFEGMFYKATAFNNGGSSDINNWPIGSNVSGKVSFGTMFSRATSFSQPLGNWDVSKVTRFSLMFEKTAAFNDPTIASWQIGAATGFANIRMDGMFQESKFNQPLSNWERTSPNLSTLTRVITMANMFQAAQFNQSIGNWDVGRVYDFSSMFSNNKFFNQASIVDWQIGLNTNSDVNMSGVFYGCPFNYPLNNWERTSPNVSSLSKVTNMSYMFGGSSAYNNAVNQWDVSKVSNFNAMFINNTIFNKDLGSWNIGGNATVSDIDMSNMFSGNTGFNQPLEDWNMSKVNKVEKMFRNSNFSVINYDKTIIAWSKQTLKAGLDLKDQNTRYCAAEVARAKIVTDFGWIFNDGKADDCQNPGGVAGVTLWLKANKDVYSDAGTTLITEDNTAMQQWNDQSISQNNASLGTGKVEYRSQGQAGGFNYHPYLQFNTSEIKDRLDGISLPIANEDKTHSFYMVFSSPANVSQNGREVFAFGDTYNTDYKLGITDGGYRVFDSGTSYYINSPAGKTEVVSALSAGSGSSAKSYVNNFLKGIATFAGGSPKVSGAYHIGSTLTSSNGTPDDLKIAEIIIYDNEHTTEKQRIESYLALKYGITLSNNEGGTAGDYLLSNGATIWDASQFSDYFYEVVGIVRDDASGMLQKQSTTPEDSLQIYLNTLTASNELNTGNFVNDLSGVMIGHNGRGYQVIYSGPNNPSNTEKPASIYARFDREWKVTNTNFSGSFSLKFNWKEVGAFNVNDLRLLVDTDGDFTDADVIASGENGITISQGSIIVSGIGTSLIPANSTRFITIGTVSSSTPLPVTLTAFSVEKNSTNGAVLTWETSSELNNSHFELERKMAGRDFETIAKVEGNGTTNEISQYNWADPNLSDGIYYYRLKQVDFDGKSTYYPIKKLQVRSDVESVNDFKLYPNPANTHLNVLSEIEGNLNVSIIDRLGKEVFRNNTKVEKGASVSMNISHLESGMYFIQVNNYRKKLVVRQ